jgi:hypothetical protein
MESPMKKFSDLINEANNCKGNLKIYMFLRDCAFRFVFNAFQNGQLTEQEKQYIKNLYPQFQMESAQYKWNIQIMKMNEYQQFLNDFYKNYNFETAEINIILMAKALTECLSFLGNYDETTKKRLEYFQNKINIYKSQTAGYSTNNLFNPHEQKITQSQVNYQNTMSQIGGGNVNNNIGSFYDPNKNKNYIPELVSRNFNLPMNKKDPNFPVLKATIEDLIENATQELDYHKVDMARKNLEAVAYYISHIID